VGKFVTDPYTGTSSPWIQIPLPHSSDLDPYTVPYIRCGADHARVYDIDRETYIDD